ncbi:MAG: Serine-pyruvate aminotransferase/archaeal aspartate aminotransferase, partial [Verrucomicrobiales bacterium]|nr:Serine-pyruvate aminotransferase/archaeal aspartate aminotransferase [Verrucomicrobiales bacterium]
MSHVKLFIPGPVEVSHKTQQAMIQPLMGHRSKDFQALYERIMPRLQSLFGTSQPVFLSTSSAWGVMEGSIRNLVTKKVLNCCCGAFSDKWYDVSLNCGKQAEALKVPWGSQITPEMVDERLATGEFDAITLVHNETSTGVLNPLAEIAAVVKKYPGVSLITDTVSSFSTVPIPFDELGLDVMLLGTQKALALPPGMALFAISPAALEKAATVKDRGYYFDFVEFRKNADNFMTPSTPVIPLIFALESKLEDIFNEGLENRFERHARLNNLVHDWVRRHGFDFFAPEGFRSKSLTCVRNNKEIDTAKLVSLMKKNHLISIDGGSGKIKGTTFRISTKGDETDA